MSLQQILALIVTFVRIVVVVSGMHHEQKVGEKIIGTCAYYSCARAASLLLVGGGPFRSHP